MKDLLDLLENKFSKNELQKMATVLNKKYRYNQFYDGWPVLDEIVFTPANIDIMKYMSKYKFNEIFNEIIMNFGKNEVIVKYFLTKSFINNENEVCMFEFPVLNSRVDFLRINGVSHAYEIKTEIDNIDRLETQLADYFKVFDYVSVVIHPKHLSKVKKSVPRRVGIITYTLNKNDIVFNQTRAAIKNNNYRKTVQLNTLNSSDLSYIIKNILDTGVPAYKKERYKLVREQYNKTGMNFVFKEAIKFSRHKKWEYIKNNIEELKPIEIQAAFSGL